VIKSSSTHKSCKNQPNLEDSDEKSETEHQMSHKTRHVSPIPFLQLPSPQTEPGERVAEDEDLEIYGRGQRPAKRQSAY